MTRTLERPTSRELQAGDTLVREAPEQRTVTAPDRDFVIPTPSRRPIRWMRWLAVIGIIAIGIGTAVYLVRDSGTETATLVPRTADGAEGWYLSTLPETVVPRTADGAEGWYLSTLPETVVPRTADGAEGWYLSTTPVIVMLPRSADGFEGWLLNLDPTVPRSADGAEGWIRSTSFIVRPEAGGPTRSAYLPVTSGEVYNYNPGRQGPNVDLAPDWTLDTTSR